MIKIKNYLYRFMEYLALGDSSFLRMRIMSLIDKNWSQWVTWLLANQNLALHSTSQVGQDLFAAYILKNKFNIDAQKTEGCFIEFGAFNGVTHSNSMLFEKLGWKGILVEPDPNNANLCTKNRSSQVIQACVTGNNSTRDSVLFNIVKSDGELSSIEGFGKYDAQTLVSDQIEVQSVKLDDLLKMQSHIDVLSMDVEGFELEILRNTDFSNRPKVIIVEHNNTSAQQDIESIMNKNNYSKFERLGGFFDDFYFDTLKAI